jgi:hypothetical protein
VQVSRVMATESKQEKVMDGVQSTESKQDTANGSADLGKPRVFVGFMSAFVRQGTSAEIKKSLPLSALRDLEIDVEIDSKSIKQLLDVQCQVLGLSHGALPSVCAVISDGIRSRQFAVVSFEKRQIGQLFQVPLC